MFQLVNLLLNAGIFLFHYVVCHPVKCVMVHVGNSKFICFHFIYSMIIIAIYASFEITP